MAAGVQYSWHDHRVHWMSPKLPSKVEAAKDVEHHIFDWEVPGTVDGEKLAIDGSLDYAPPKDSLPGRSAAGGRRRLGRCSSPASLWFGLRRRRS